MERSYTYVPKSKGPKIEDNIMDTVAIKGAIRIYPENDPKKVIFEDHNIIVNVVKWLFARMMANTLPGSSSNTGSTPLGNEVLYSLWGLALGSGDPSWSPDTQPVETATQTALITQILRKQLTTANYVDSNFNPISTFSTIVDFQTVVNATTDNINQVAIREMGLIGGGTIATINPVVPATNMLTAPYFNPTLVPPGPANSVVLINYKTLPPLILPPEVNIIFSWVLSF